MKKTLILGIVLVLCLFLIGCVDTINTGDSNDLNSLSSGERKILQKFAEYIENCQEYSLILKYSDKKTKIDILGDIKKTLEGTEYCSINCTTTVQGSRGKSGFMPQIALSSVQGASDPSNKLADINELMALFSPSDFLSNYNKTELLIKYSVNSIELRKTFCNLGDVMLCMDWSARTDDEISDGDDDDPIRILLNNNLTEMMYNATLTLSRCTNDAVSEELPIIEIGKTKLFNLTCAGLKPGETFESEIILNYETKINNITTKQQKTGYIIIERIPKIPGSNNPKTTTNNKCTDSDTYINYHKKGTIKIGETEMDSDYCMTDLVGKGDNPDKNLEVEECSGGGCYLIEFFCDKEKFGQYSSHSTACLKTCKNGTCLEREFEISFDDEKTKFTCNIINTKKGNEFPEHSIGCLLTNLDNEEHTYKACVNNCKSIDKECREASIKANKDVQMGFSCEIDDIEKITVNATIVDLIR